MCQTSGSRRQGTEGVPVIVLPEHRTFEIVFLITLWPIYILLCHRASFSENTSMTHGRVGVMSGAYACVHECACLGENWVWSEVP